MADTSTTSATNLDLKTDIYFDLPSLQIDNTNINVNKSIGELAYMVIIKDTKDNFEIKVQIEHSFSNEMIILLKDSTLTKDQINTILSSINKSLTKTGTSRIVEIYNFIQKSIQECEKISLKSSNKKNTKKSKQNNKNQKNIKEKSQNAAAAADKNNEKGKNSSSGGFVNKGEKLSSMKTAIDVINRILWDNEISSSDISVGYHDRFLGILEKPFDAFSWENLASLDYYTFGIPKHRIAYFKYRKAIIWHKEKRIDRVFGSRDGCGITIDQIIANYSDENYAEESKQLTMQNNAAQDNQSSVLEFSEGEDLSDSDDDDDDDDDDGIDVIINIDKPTPSGDAASDDNDDDDYNDNRPRPLHSMKREYWTDKLRPNFFVCVRVTNPEICDKVSKIQEVICNQDSRYASCCTSSDMLHITLCTLRLQDAEQVSECLQVIAEAKVELEKNLPKTPLHLSGMDRFFGRVLYAKVNADEHFFEFVSQLNMELRAAGMPIADSHTFVPHMSILKINRPTARSMQTRVIPYLYEAETTDFGYQTIESIYLCSMEKTRGPDGFYITPGSVTFMKQVVSATQQNNTNYDDA